MKQAARGRGVVVHGDADDLQPLRAVLPLPRGEDRHLHLARRAPGGPEVEQNHLAAEAGERERLAAEVFEREVRRFFVEQVLRRKATCAAETRERAMSAGQNDETHGGEADARAGGFALFSTLNRKPLVYPIGAEIIGQIENLHAGESHIGERLVRGSHVRAAIPRAAATIDHDEGLARQGPDTGAQLLQARIL